MRLKFILGWVTGFLMIPFLATAQNAAPRYLNIQAVLTDNGGNVLYDLQESDITFQIIDGSGQVYYTEVQSVPIVNGMISVLMGQGTDPTTGEATGGIPYDALSPDGDRLVRIKLAEDSIPQEDISLASIAYSYYAQYALDLPTDTVTTDHILNGTVTQDDFSQDLLDYIDSSMTGISEQDLLDHKSEDGAHSASSISLQGGYVYISSGDLEGAIDEIDQAISTRATDIESIETDVTDLQNQITQEISDRQAGDQTLQTNIDNEASARQSADTTLQQNIDNEAATRFSADTSLQQNIDNEANTRSSADSTLQTNIDNEASARASADSTLQTAINGKVSKSGDTVTGDIAVSESCSAVAGDNTYTTDPNCVTFDGVDPSELADRIEVVAGQQDDPLTDDDIPLAVRPLAYGRCIEQAGDDTTNGLYNIAASDDGTADCDGNMIYTFTNNAPSSTNYLVMITTHEICGGSCSQQCNVYNVTSSSFQINCNAQTGYDFVVYYNPSS